MGKRSIKANKNMYQTCREEANLTREKASELMDYISADRIEKIESERSLPHPDEILTMATCYKAPALVNHYCSQECTIGQTYVPEIKAKDLSQITLELVASINALEKQKGRLIEITVDGEITEDEYTDFAKIQNQLENISMAVRTLQLWMEQMILDGKIDAAKLTEIKNELRQ